MHHNACAADQETAAPAVAIGLGNFRTYAFAIMVCLGVVSIGPRSAIDAASRCRLPRIDAVDERTERILKARHNGDVAVRRPRRSAS